MAHDGREYFLEHRRGKPPGIGVVAAAMVAVEKRDAVGERMPRAVCKRVVASARSQREQCRIVRDPSERKKRRTGGQRRQLGGEIGVARPDFDRQGLVAGWKALHRVGDPRVDEAQLVDGTERLWAV